MKIDCTKTVRRVTGRQEKCGRPAQRWVVVGRMSTTVVDLCVQCMNGIKEPDLVYSYNGYVALHGDPLDNAINAGAQRSMTVSGPLFKRISRTGVRSQESAR